MTLALTDAEIWAGALELTTRTNEVAGDASCDELDSTAFRASWRERIGGLKMGEFALSGWYDPAAIETGALVLDLETFAAVGRSSSPITVAVADTDGGPAYLGEALETSLNYFGGVGVLAPFDATMLVSGAMGRGKILHPRGTLRTASADGTGRQLGAVAVGQTLLVAVHVFTVSGTTPSLTVEVESDTSVLFAGPVVQATSAAFTAPGSALLEVAGPITDDWWRVALTVSGTTPSFRIGIAAAIVTP